MRNSIKEYKFDSIYILTKIVNCVITGRGLMVIFFLVASLAVDAQNTIGIPAIVNYPKEAYNAGSQNWGMAQDRNGMLYVANNQGLLSFDGTFWRKYPLPNKTIARSVAIGNNNRIYIGGQNCGLIASRISSFLSAR